ncbi:hypothetical protein D3C73_1070510 [compost metagenome]
MAIYCDMWRCELVKFAPGAMVNPVSLTSYSGNWLKMVNQCLRSASLPLAWLTSAAALNKNLASDKSKLVHSKNQALMLLSLYSGLELSGNLRTPSFKRVMFSR